MAEIDGGEGLVKVPSLSGLHSLCDCLKWLSLLVLLYQLLVLAYEELATVDDEGAVSKSQL